MADDFTDDQSSVPSGTPDWLAAADAHNLAAGQPSMLSNLADSITHAPKWLALGVGSGAVGLYNTAASIVTLGDKDSQVNYGDWVDQFDSDLGKYYRENKSSIDLFGNVVSSFVPGMAGVKAYNLGLRALQVGQATGKIGSLLGRATGLLTDGADLAITRGAQTMAGSNQAWSALSSSMVKATSIKILQGTMESFAFEGAALAATYKSPFYDDQSAGDIAFNFAVGGLFGGTLMGALAIPGLRKNMMSQVAKLDEAGNANLLQPKLGEGSSPTSQAAQELYNKDTLQNYIGEFSQPQTQTLDSLPQQVLTNNLANARKGINNIDNFVRTQVRAATADSSDEIGNYFADAVLAMAPKDGAHFLVGADELHRVATLGTKEIPGPTGKMIKVTNDDGMQWVKLFDGNNSPTGAPTWMLDHPPVATLADTLTLKPGDTMEKALDRFSNGFQISPRGANTLDVTAKGTTVADAQARFYRAEDATFKPGTNGIVTAVEGDIPMVEAMYAKLGSTAGVNQVQILDRSGKVVRQFTPTDKNLFNELILQKNDAVSQLRKANPQMSAEEIAERTNVDPGFVNGLGVGDDDFANYMYRQNMAQKLGVTTKELFQRPQYLGVRSTDFEASELAKQQFHLDAQAWFDKERAVWQQSIDNATNGAAIQMGDTEFKRVWDTLPDGKVVDDAASAATRVGAGSRLFTFANGNYGSPQEMFQWIGQRVQNLKQRFAGALEADANPVLTSLRNNQGVAADVAAINSLAARTPLPYVYDEQTGGLVLKAVRDFEEATSEFNAGGQLGNPPLEPRIPQGVRERIEVQNPETSEFLKWHIGTNANYVNSRNAIWSARGINPTYDPETYYAVKPNPSNYPHFALVNDARLAGDGQTTMIFARDGKKLQDMITRIQSEFPDYRVITKGASEDYHKALGDYQYDRSIHAPQIDSSLASKGIMSEFMPVTDGNTLADNFLQFHKNRGNSMISEMVGNKYDTAFSKLEAATKIFSDVQGSSVKTNPFSLTVARSPFEEYKRVALGISNASEYPLLNTINKALDSGVSSVWNAAADQLKRAKSTEDLAAINDTFAAHGFKTAYYDAATELLANQSAKQNVLSQGIRAINGALSSTFLRFDFLNAAVNRIGSAVLGSSELSYVLNMLKSDPESLGKLGNLAQVKVPGTGDQMFSASKLILKANQDFFSNYWGQEGKSALLARYKSNGWVLDEPELQKFAQATSFDGTENVAQVQGKLRSLLDTSQYLGQQINTWTGNKAIESMNRFTSARVMDLLTEQAVKRGLMSQAEADAAINTFVNRTQVNLTYAQRPVGFQGPLGAMFGLFQSYQANLMQQMFRYIEPGARKSAAMLMGLQGSFYGLNGLPGFQSFNEHILAQAHGNYNHDDLYSKIYGATNYDTANFLLYGVPSNILRTNLYSRGDITPSHSTIIPGSFAETMQVSTLGNLFTTMRNTVKQVENGVPIWDAMLTGLEHNGLNRPLAGLAQVARAVTQGGRVTSTNNQGALVGANDLASWATITRLAGGKPLDEAVFRDQAYRITQYKNADNQARQQLGQDLTRAYDQGSSVPDSYSFMTKYLAYGGKQTGFNQWMMSNFAKSTSNQSANLKNIIGSPLGYRLQAMMGGIDPDTFQAQ